MEVVAACLRLLKQQPKRSHIETDPREVHEEIKAQEAHDPEPREPWQHANFNVGKGLAVRGHLAKNITTGGVLFTYQARIQQMTANIWGDRRYGGS